MGQQPSLQHQRLTSDAAAGATKLLVLGLDWSGKSSLVHRLMSITGQTVWDVAAAAATRFSVDVVNLEVDSADEQDSEEKARWHFRCRRSHQRKHRLIVWDAGGGRNRNRALLRHYVPSTHGLMFVIDCADRRRLTEATDELRLLLKAEQELDGLPLAVACNKSDNLEDGKDGPVGVAEIEGALLADADIIGGQQRRRRACRCFATSAFTGRGVREAFGWLAGEAATVREDEGGGSGGWMTAWVKRPTLAAWQLLSR